MRTRMNRRLLVPLFLSAFLPVGFANASTQSGSVPAVPANLTIGSITASTLTMSWSPSPKIDPPVLRYELSLDGGAPNPDTGPSQTWTLLTPNTTYSYRVRACNAVGCSTYSSAVAATTKAAASIPAVPAGLTVSESPNELRASWSPSVNNGDAPVAVYEVSLNNAPPKSGPQLSQVFNNIAPNTKYLFQVRACNAVGCSPYSSAVTGITGGSTPSTVVVTSSAAASTIASTVVSTAVGKAVPATPRNVGINSITSSSLTIAWVGASGAEIAATRFEVSLDGGPPNPGVETLQTWTQLMPDTAFSFQVRACNEVGCSPYSAVVVAKTRGAMSVPSQPAKPYVSVVKSGGLRVSWLAPKDETGVPVENYELILNNQKPTSTKALSYSFVGVAAKSRFTVRIRACNSVGCSPFATLRGRVPASTR
jgi:Fibronectin type III domain